MEKAFALWLHAHEPCSVNINTTDATTGATALLLPAQDTHPLHDPIRDTEHARARGIEDSLCESRRKQGIPPPNRAPLPLPLWVNLNGVSSGQNRPGKCLSGVCDLTSYQNWLRPPELLNWNCYFLEGGRVHT
jgi:hypothetical protein